MAIHYKNKREIRAAIRRQGIFDKLREEGRLSIPTHADVTQLATRLAERPAGDRHLRSARLTSPLCIVSNTRLCCGSKSIAATAKPAGQQCFGPIPRQRCCHLQQRFSVANASGKFEQRRARIVVFDLDAPISSPC